MPTLTGHCHCGAVRFEVDTDLSRPMRCNCSFCVRRGTMLHRVDTASFRLLTGREALTRYGSREFSDHYFCSTCGIFPFTEIDRSGERSVVVNIGCLDGVDTSALSPKIFDGAKLL